MGHAPADHPHARGDYKGRSRQKPCCRGPSPRAWGLPYQTKLHAITTRTIPTRVGITEIPRVHRAPIMDHPHARGDYALSEPIVNRIRGPSPRAWGLPISRPTHSGNARTIPTRVGITALTILDCYSCTDHPHARGDYRLHLFDVHRDGGPSPRAWGLPPPPV